MTAQHPQSSRVLPDDGIIDPVAVEIAARGSRPVALTPPERLLAAARILARGGTPYLIAERLHVSGTTALNLAAELADCATRSDRDRTGRQLPRTLHSLCEQARLMPCEQCGTPAGTPCGRRPVAGYHLARFAAAHRRGLLTSADMDTVLDAAGPVFTNHSLIRDEGSAR